mmetsp:Transcript_100540/g.284767  ORF Transcript_100540/g.284767 Transcript_100540/m.284767 type:complete len:208 (+) Transcript_100540:96-719(+)
MSLAKNAVPTYRSSLMGSTMSSSSRSEGGSSPSLSEPVSLSLPVAFSQDFFASFSLSNIFLRLSPTVFACSKESDIKMLSKTDPLLTVHSSKPTAPMSSKWYTSSTKSGFSSCRAFQSPLYSGLSICGANQAPLNLGLSIIGASQIPSSSSSHSEGFSAVGSRMRCSSTQSSGRFAAGSSIFWVSTQSSGLLSAGSSWVLLGKSQWS